jgi:hypothetical protein
MTMAKDAHRKRYGLFILAIIMLMFGGAILLLYSNNPLIMPFGGLMCVFSAYLVKVSNVHRKADVTVADGNDTGSNVAKPPSLTTWAIGLAVLLALGVSYFYLRKDAIDGYHEILPVYFFAGAIFVCAGVWAYLLAKVMRK